jgi:hypothetical protein
VIPLALAIVALALAAADEIRAQGQSLLGWAVCALAVALLWGRIA